MNFGKFDRYITLRRPVQPPQDEYGAHTPAVWLEVAKVYAEMKYNQGSEATQAEQLTAVQPVIWQLRYRPDIQPTWQLIYQGTIYEITAVAEIGRRAGLILTTQARGTASPPLLLPSAYKTALNTTDYQANGIVFGPDSSQELYFNELTNPDSNTIILQLLDSSDGSTNTIEPSTSYEGQTFTMKRADGSLYGGVFPPIDQIIPA